MLPRAPHQATLDSPLGVEAAGQRYHQTAQLLYLGGIILENADLWLKIDRRVRFQWAYVEPLGQKLYDRTTVPFSLKAGMLKAEMIETLM